MVLVSLASQVVGERQHEVALSEQLLDAQQYLRLGKEEAPAFSFTYEVEVYDYVSDIICDGRINVVIVVQGSCAVSYRRKNLLVYDLETDTNYRYIYIIVSAL